MDRILSFLILSVISIVVAFGVGFPAQIDMNSAAYATQFKGSSYIWTGDAAGTSVGGFTDLNKDGISDLIIGSYLAEDGALVDTGIFFHFSHSNIHHIKVSHHLLLSLLHQDALTLSLGNPLHGDHHRTSKGIQMEQQGSRFGG